MEIREGLLRSLGTCSRTRNTAARRVGVHLLNMHGLARVRSRPAGYELVALGRTRASFSEASPACGGGSGGASEEKEEEAREEEDLVLSSGCAITVTVKPPKDMLAGENLAGCVGRSRLRNGHELRT